MKPAQDGKDWQGVVIGGRYRVDALIGRGGFASVYRATHLAVQQDVALKLLHPELRTDASQSERFVREARHAGRLNHPNSVRVFDCGATEDGVLYLVMEYLEGQPLSMLTRQRLPIAVPRVLRIITQVAKALAEAHSLGLVHRDLKPDNIFLTRVYGETDYVKVLDYGIAKAVDAGDSTLTAVGTIIGTPTYMSPEQADGRPGGVDHRSDLYSLGVLLFHMLAGRAPFESPSAVEVLMQHVMEPAPDLREVPVEGQRPPPALCAAVTRLLQKEPAGRYPSAMALVEELETMAASLAPGPAVGSPVPALGDCLVPEDSATVPGAGAEDLATAPAEFVDATVLLEGGLGEGAEDLDSAPAKSVDATVLLEGGLGEGAEDPGGRTQSMQTTPAHLDTGDRTVMMSEPISPQRDGKMPAPTQSGEKLAPTPPDAEQGPRPAVPPLSSPPESKGVGIVWLAGLLVLALAFLAYGMRIT